MKFFSFSFFVIVSFLFFSAVQAQQPGTYPGFKDEISKRITEDSSSRLHVSAITVSGNKKTKAYIILREMKCKTGDSIIAGQLYNLIEESRNLVYNTSLFSVVEIVPVLASGKDVVIKVKVLEKLYVYPTPQFRLVDRNFNDWIKTYHANLNRVIYGAKFEHYNLSGRGDKLKIYLLNGYARALSFSYSAPSSNRALSEGFSFAGGYTQSREISYKTSADNKLLQFKMPGFVRDNFYASASYQRRLSYFKRHSISISYNYIKVNDSVINAKYNPAYFNSGRTTASFPDLSYSFQYSRTDNVNYPLKGKYYRLSALKRGVDFTKGINMLMFDGLWSRFLCFKNFWYGSVETQGKLKIPFNQAYINQPALGYGDFNLRGLEYYVVDGTMTALSKYTLKKKILSFNIPVPFHIKKIPEIPFAIYAKTYADLGYSYNQKQFDTKLNNRLLYTGGLGIDVVSIYDATLRIEYSFNQLGENGLFLHARSGF